MPQKRRIFVDLTSSLNNQESSSLCGTSISVGAKNHHYLTHVLRLQVGDALTVICRSSGRSFDAQLESISDTDSATLLLDEILQSAHTPRVGALCFANCKGKKNDLVLEKATELGVERIIIWQAEHSVSLIKGEKDLKKKLERWEKIVESACLQSGKTTIPSVHFACNASELACMLDEFGSPQDTRLCCSLRKNSVLISDLEPPTHKAHLLIGPEGDMTEAEQNIFSEMNCRFITLGPYVLRSETAAIAAIASVQAVWGACRE